MRISHGLPRARRPSAVTIGNFDGVHQGHQAMLRLLNEEAQARQLEAAVITFEPHPREFFSPESAPTRLTSLREKLEILHDHNIDHVHICRFDRAFSRLTAEEFIDRILVNGLQAHWVLVGDDFRFGAKRAGDADLMCEAGRKQGFEVRVMHTVQTDGERASSTAVREALAGGDMERAWRLLGRPYSISGHVMGGDKLGRQFGFPTANIQLKHNRPPLWGIFVVEACLPDACMHPGVASLGVRPTVHEKGRPTLEVHLFDFEHDIYRDHVRVDFLHKLRDEEKFSDLDTLVAQIKNDADQAKDYFAKRNARLQKHA
jgi:riboflavin kinase / FMN adenylyltransferase